MQLSHLEPQAGFFVSEGLEACDYIGVGIHVYPAINVFGIRYLLDHEVLSEIFVVSDEGCFIDNLLNN